jgi:SEFIR domain
MEDRHHEAQRRIAPKAFVSWAHDDEAWQSTVATFAFAARELGIDADIDLWHLHEPNMDWTTYGPQAIQEGDFVLIPVNSAYRRRWEGVEERGKGAGAAREANTLKALFDDDQLMFRRKVKLIVLPGATTDDIPVELKAVVQRFEIETFDESGFEDLLRTLTNRPAFVPPPVGSLPLLPPKSVGAGPRTDTKYAMADTILTLPEREKLAVALTYYERLTRDEIAENPWRLP